MIGYAIANTDTNIVASLLSFGDVKIDITNYPVEQGFYLIELNDSLYQITHEKILQGNRLKVVNQSSNIFEEKFDLILKSLDELKSTKVKELDVACTSAILGRFKATLKGVEYEFSYDREAQSRFSGIGVLFLGNKITEIPWTAYVNGERVRIILTKEDFDIVSMAALNHENNNVIRYNQLLQDVDNASINELNTIVW